MKRFPMTVDPATGRIHRADAEPLTFVTRPPTAREAEAELRYVLEGEPVPWQRARSTRAGRRYTDPRMAQAKLCHALMARTRRIEASATRSFGALDRDGRFELEVIAYVSPRARGDADNYAKLVADALQGVLYPNDRQVVRCVGERRVDRERPRTEVRLRRVSP